MAEVANVALDASGTRSLLYQARWHAVVNSLFALDRARGYCSCSRAQQPPRRGLTRTGWGWKGRKKGLTYEVACHMLQAFRKQTVLAIGISSPTQRRSSRHVQAGRRRRRRNDFAAVAFGQGNSVRPHRGPGPIRLSGSEGFSTYRSPAIYACCRNAMAHGLAYEERGDWAP